MQSVEQARRAMTRIDDLLNEHLRNVYLAAPPSGVNVTEWREAQEMALRAGAEREKIPYKAVILMDELHQSYEEDKPDHEEQEAMDDGKTFETHTASLSTDEKSQADTSHLLQDAFNNKEEKLELSNRLLSSIPESLGQIVTLVSLNLSDNQLKSLPNSIAGLVNLESLKVNSNQLETLPDSIGSLTKLKYLDVSSNALRKLPEGIGRCSSLLELNANFNHLEFIPASFGFMLVCLQKLELHLNRLKTIPPSVCQIKSLNHLDLHMNKMKGLPASIGNLTQLEYLDVSSNFNDLVSLPESVGDLVSLTYCDLSFNQIKELPDTLGRLEKLRTLKLEGNPLVVPPMDVVEHSHDAVMAYLHQRYVNTTVGDFQVSASSKTLLYNGRTHYNPWVPACGNSPLAAWMGSICGNMGNVLGGGTGDFLGFQKYQRDEMLGQRL
ncbi:unnamed protein product [Calypogeia fissa]